MKFSTPNHRPLFGTPIAPWHWWFSWHPVGTWDGRIVWLVPVMRRRIQKHSYLTGPDFNWWEYHFIYGYVEEPK